MKPWALSFPAVFFTILNLSCATLIRGNRDYLTIRDVPPGITLRINGAPASPNTCYEFDLDEDSAVELLAEQKLVGTIRIRSEFYAPTLVPSFFMGGPVGILVDYKAGGLYRLREDPIRSSGREELANIRLESDCGPEWNRYRISVQGGITLQHADSGRKTAETQFNQGWVTLGGRGFKRFEVFSDMFFLRYADADDPGQKVRTAYSLPLPFITAPTGLNLYVVSHPRMDVFLGAGYARFSLGAIQGELPLTAQLGSRVRFKGYWELIAQLKYLSISYPEDNNLETSILADRWILLYGLSRSWR